MKKQRIHTVALLLVLTIAGLISCGDKVDPGDENPEARANWKLYNFMNNYYYWYTSIPDVDPSDYSDPYELLEAVRNTPVDRFSYVADREEFEAYFNEGTYAGHGFSYGLDLSGNVRILFVYEDSDMYSQGVRRSWIIKQINGTPVFASSMDPVTVSNLFTTISTLLGPGTPGLSNNFEFEDPEGNAHTVISEKKDVSINSVLHSDTLHINGQVVGHLVFETFIDPSYNELEESFSFFKSVGATDLILDLRYNGGGIMDVARVLSSLITGTATGGQPFITYEFNDKLTEENFTINLENMSHSLNLNRLFVITAYGTASASESVINGLKPYIDITTVGDTTYGKPVGMISQTYEDYVWVPITFKMVNADSEGDYFYGIPPMHYVSDDPTHAFGDREEHCLQAVIQYLETGSFGSLKQGVRDLNRPYHPRNWITRDYWVF